ncbi:MAG: FlgD immunoglobulin-like domain containing protein [Candidatus Eisenbacteria bacterium]|nr:FlgD immunoglobulin-like domain containing protein [Candidatus Eisenbacteria bacterium]
MYKRQDVLGQQSFTGSDGLLYLRDGDGSRRPFVTSVDDDRIQNRGDGRFHCVTPDQVREALEQIDPAFLHDLRFDIWILPYPVAEPLGSWASDGILYLSPTVLALDPRQVSFLVAHEVGHLVHAILIPDSDLQGWDEYRTVRGIEDENRFHAGAVHRDRPHEIFAEDFRWFFGGELARNAGAIENLDLPEPDEVPGLQAFFLGLLPDPALLSDAGLRAKLYPNPLPSGRRLSLILDAGDTSPVVRLHDASGRLVRILTGWTATGAGHYELLWDGRSGTGQQLASGVYFASIEGARGRALPVRILR